MCLRNDLKEVWPSTLQRLGFVGLVLVAGTGSSSHWRRLGALHLEWHSSNVTGLRSWSCQTTPGDKNSWGIEQERNLVLSPKLLHSPEYKIGIMYGQSLYFGYFLVVVDLASFFFSQIQWNKSNSVHVSCKALQSVSALLKVLYWKNKYVFALAEFTFWTLFTSTLWLICWKY